MLKITIIALFLSLEVVAQVTQGGPPGDDLHSDTEVNWTVNDNDILLVMDVKAQKIVPSLEKAWNKCMVSSSIKKVTFLDISEFYQLLTRDVILESLKQMNSGLDQTKKVKSYCPEDECNYIPTSKMNCMKNEVAQNELKDFTTSPYAIKYLELKLKVSNDNAKFLHKLTQDLEKK